MREGLCPGLVPLCRSTKNALFISTVFDLSLSSARFLKTVRCRHRNGPLVVKIFIKPDPGVSLRKFQRRLKSACSTIYCNCLPLTSNLLLSRTRGSRGHRERIQLSELRGDREGWLFDSTMDCEQLVRPHQVRKTSYRTQ